MLELEVKKSNPKHLYIHIPFCKHICAFCDFVRFTTKSDKTSKYINKIIKQLEKFEKFETIYIGGGTPNYLEHKQLEKLLKECSKHLENKYEFTIECNPEFVTQEQVNIFKTNKVNRISLGAQSTNNGILKKYGRIHTIEKTKEAIKTLYKNKISNVSLDFIYGFNEMTAKDISNSIKFIKENKIKHVSYYSLEIKEGSILNQKKYKSDDEKIESQLKLIIKSLGSYKRYEVSSWASNKKYESIHNKAYWQTKDWIGVGLGAYGLENMTYYVNKGTIDKFKKVSNKLEPKDYYFQIIMMGLRLKDGIDLSDANNKKAYQFYKDKLNFTNIKNNHLFASDINKIDDILIELID